MNKRILIYLGFFILLFMFGAVVGTPAFGKASKKSSKPKWKYIIIHHSATKRGNAKTFDKYHRKRGMKNGLAYHFVISNGTSHRRDGQLEIGNRWKKQLSGGHCRQSWLNNQGIGICLVGNFNTNRPTNKQIRTLVNLIKELKRKYNIPTKNILGHGKIKGEKSQCPGKYFPWKKLKAELKTR